MNHLSNDYYSVENLAKRDLQYENLKNIERSIELLQKQYAELTEKYCKENNNIRHKYIVYTIIDADILPYGWCSEGSTHIGDIAESFENNSDGWLSSTTRCE